MDFGGGPCLDTVRALHQTVVALRAALEKSRSEILELKTKSFSVETVQDTIRSLVLENHVLKNRIDVEEKPTEKKRNFGKLEARISIKAKKNFSKSLESLLVVKAPIDKKLSLTKTVSFSNIVEMNNEDQPPQNDLEEQDQDQDQEVDDIELIFTTDETKDSDFKEQLVSIDAGDSNPDGNLLQCPDSDNLDISDRELDDDVFNDTDVDFRRENSQLYNSKSDNSINQEKSLKSCYSYQDSSFENKSLEKDESFDRFEERIRIVETDISKCGIQEVEYGGLRRNTCPNPLQYRPLLHR